MAERVLELFSAPRQLLAHELGITEISIIAGRHVGHQLKDSVVLQVLILFGNVKRRPSMLSEVTSAHSVSGRSIVVVSIEPTRLFTMRVGL
jgi:hypothetical protein